MRAYTDIFGRRFGFESNRVHVSGRPYIDRWIVYLGGLNLRVHRFWEGDDERAPHDHPWWFITFPFTGYWESIDHERVRTIVWRKSIGWTEDGRKVVWANYRRINYVKPWRFHFRPGTYRHIVLRSSKPAGKPWWTFVIAGHRTRVWGFYPADGSFVPWTEWV